MHYIVTYEKSHKKAVTVNTKYDVTGTSRKVLIDNNHSLALLYERNVIRHAVKN